MKRVPERSPFPRLLVFPLLLLVGGGLVAARFFPQILQAYPPCPWQQVTSLPCPTCGSTQAVLSLVRGHPGTALASNPGLIVCLALCLGWAVLALAATLRPAWRFSLALGSREKKAARYLAALLILINWAWLLRAATV